MSKSLAVALCRVSSVEQLENNSLNRQRASVLAAAEHLKVTIPEDYWWAGSVSSKSGTNLKRDDLNQIINVCRKDKRVKYVIVDEPDRFMRSIDEAAYFEVTFKQLGVIVWYASDPELNKGDLASKLLKFTKYLSAEGSNEERQRKSISGQTKALLEGRYPFSPKPGYKRGYMRGVQEIHPTRGPALKAILIRVADKLITPSQGLVELNNSAFMDNHSPYKMDKFRKIATDPFYAGIVEIKKQVNVRNENGLHEPLITKAQHEALVKIMAGKKKNQGGPRKNGNPLYPLSNMVSHDLCNHRKYGRLVGVSVHNGKNTDKIYEKYRCRACLRSLTRQELHDKVMRHFKRNPINREGRDDLLEALNIVWRQKEGEAEQEANRLRHKIRAINDSIAQQVEAATDPANSVIKDDILAAITRKKNEVIELEDQLDKLRSDAHDDKERFLKFAFDFAENMGSKFLEIAPENRLRCKQIVFPAGFRLDENKNVYTPEISYLITLQANKKALTHDAKAHLVRVMGL